VSAGVALAAQTEVGHGGAALLVANGLLKEHQTRDRKAVGKASLAALGAPIAGCGSTRIGFPVIN